jgi:hypothetical protein
MWENSIDYEAKFLKVVHRHKVCVELVGMWWIIDDQVLPQYQPYEHWSFVKHMSITI